MVFKIDIVLGTNGREPPVKMWPMKSDFGSRTLKKKELPSRCTRKVVVSIPSYPWSALDSTYTNSSIIMDNSNISAELLVSHQGQRPLRKIMHVPVYTRPSYSMLSFACSGGLERNSLGDGDCPTDSNYDILAGNTRNQPTGISSVTSYAEFSAGLNSCPAAC